MEEADKLCAELFHWLENRKKCARKLLELARELEDVHEGSNTVQMFGAAASVGAISGAVIATFLTGGLASPLVGVAGASYTAVKVSSTLLEKIMSSSTFEQATKLIEKDEKAGTHIQNLLQDLKDRCGETLKDRCGGALLGTHADELDCEVTTQLMCAMARRSNTPVPLDFLRSFNRATFFRHNAHGGLDRAKASGLICKALGAVGFFSLITCSLKVSGKVMMKNIGHIGIKAAEAGSTAMGVIGVGMSLRDLIVKTKDLVKDNRVTKASKFLRDSAREIRDDQQKLKEQLDAMQEIIQKLLQMKRIIENLGEYSHSMDENGQRIIDYIMETYTDDTVLSWLQGLSHQIKFVNLVRFFQKWLSPILKKPGGGHIHIVFVAHGSIVDQFIPASVLVPTPNIRDTILYSPWNCAIDANAAFAIAQGNIQVRDREFYKEKITQNGVRMVHYEPDFLPNHWNSMRRSWHNIPNILLYPVTPEDKAWADLQRIWMNKGREIGDRVIIPYLVPKDEKKAFGKIPLYMFIFATSCLLMLSNKTATVHLAACLSREKSPLRPEERVRQEWQTQYAYTIDGAWMSVNLDNTNMDSELYRALKSLFDTNRR